MIYILNTGTAKKNVIRWNFCVFNHYFYRLLYSIPYFLGEEIAHDVIALRFKDSNDNDSRQNLQYDILQIDIDLI